jgi:hypothetical protein
MHINMTHFHWSVEIFLCHINLPPISVMYPQYTHIFRMNFFISILLKKTFNIISQKLIAS